MPTVGGTTTAGATTTTTGNPTDLYQTSDIDTTSDANKVYIGKETPEGGWFIEEINLTTLTFRYCKGSQAYTANWGNRLLLTYEIFDKVF